MSKDQVLLDFKAKIQSVDEKAMADKEQALSDLFDAAQAEVAPPVEGAPGISADQEAKDIALQVEPLNAHIVDLDAQIAAMHAQVDQEEIDKGALAASLKSAQVTAAEIKSKFQAILDAIQA
jgi:hypothetical protein